MTYRQANRSTKGGRWREDWTAGFIGEQCDDSSYRYHGPVVNVSFDEHFVTVETDPYEGSAMFCLANLPDVIAMLREVAKESKRQKSARGEKGAQA